MKMKCEVGSVRCKIYGLDIYDVEGRAKAREVGSRKIGDTVL